MAKILTGIQSTGTPHLGNLIGAIIPAIELSEKPENETFLFIADLHSTTQIKDGKLLRANTYSTGRFGLLAVWMWRKSFFIASRISRKPLNCLGI